VFTLKSTAKAFKVNFLYTTTLKQICVWLMIKLSGNRLNDEGTSRGKSLRFAIYKKVTDKKDNTLVENYFIE